MATSPETGTLTDPHARICIWLYQDKVCTTSIHRRFSTTVSLAVSYTYGSGSVNLLCINQRPLKMVRRGAKT